ncbi:hypothetical protein GCM10027514_23900 [Azotobacter armeniacus]
MKQSSGTRVTGPAAASQSAWLPLQKPAWTLTAAGLSSSQARASGGGNGFEGFEIQGKQTPQAIGAEAQEIPAARVGGMHAIVLIGS